MKKIKKLLNLILMISMLFAPMTSFAENGESFIQQSHATTSVNKISIVQTKELKERILKEYLFTNSKKDNVTIEKIIKNSAHNIIPPKQEVNSDLIELEKMDTTTSPAIEVSNLKFSIKMNYDDKSYFYPIGSSNENTDKTIYKSTKINWSYDAGSEKILEEEWQNKKETYNSYEQQTVKLRLKDKDGKWTNWNEVKFTVTNRPPVAELQYVLLNEDSLKDGKLTTDSQIAWLWMYQNQMFFFDPDGDEIVDVHLGGIQEKDIINPNLDGGEEYQGFVTQFSEPGKYTLTFAVQDKEGLWSKAASYTFEVVKSDKIIVPAKKIIVTDVISKETPNANFKFSHMVVYSNIQEDGFAPADAEEEKDMEDTFYQKGNGSIIENRWIDEKAARESCYSDKPVVLPPAGNYDTFTIIPRKFDAVRVTGPKTLEVIKPLVKGEVTIKGRVLDENDKPLANKMLNLYVSMQDVNHESIGQIVTDQNGNYEVTLNLAPLATQMEYRTKYAFLGKYNTYYYEEIKFYIEDVDSTTKIEKSVLLETYKFEGYNFVGRDLIRKPGWCKFLSKNRPYDYWTSLSYLEYCKQYSHLPNPDLGIRE